MFRFNVREEEFLPVRTFGSVLLGGGFQLTVIIDLIDNNANSGQNSQQLPELNELLARLSSNPYSVDSNNDNIASSPNNSKPSKQT